MVTRGAITAEDTWWNVRSLGNGAVVGIPGGKHGLWEMVTALEFIHGRYVASLTANSIYFGIAD